MDKKKLITPIVMLVVVASVFSVGTAYALAHYGGAEITDNSTEDVYATLSPKTDAMFSGVFDKTIYYNTYIHYDGSKITQYYLTPGQTETVSVSGVNKSVIPLGTLILQLEQFGDVQDFNLFIQKLAGTMNGTFYIGLATSEDDSTYGAFSYYEFDPSGTTISSLSSTVGFLKIILFLDASFHTDGATSITVPMTDVSFLFRADVTA